MEEKEMSPQESMALINNMINRARRRYKDNSFFFLLWGWIVLVASGSHFYFLEFTDYPYPYIGWSLNIIGAIASVIRSIKDAKKAVVSSYADRIYGYLWLALGLAMFTLVFNGEMFEWAVVPFILLLVAIGTFVSGAMMKFVPLQVGGIAFWILCFVAFRVSEAQQMLIMSISMIGYLIPGYMIRHKAKHNGV